MSMTATAQVLTSEPTSAPVQERIHSLQSGTAWEGLLLVCERWQELSRDVERQAVAEALSYSQTP